MTQTISQLSFDKNGIYKQTTLKNLYVVNYDLKGVTPASARGGRPFPPIGCTQLLCWFLSSIDQFGLFGYRRIEQCCRPCGRVHEITTLILMGE